MTSRIASLALTTAFFFLIVVAILLNSPALFYMGTALIATIGASRFQAYLAVRGLRFERHVPESAQRGELITVEVTVWSERRIRRPLVSIRDHLPNRLIVTERSPSLPVAPAFDIPIRTYYRFRPMRRGKYRWSDLTVIGSDALGLVSLEKVYSLETVELTVMPSPMAVSVPFPPAFGWGSAESEQGRARGSGLEPRGVRDYSSGDSMRFVHWRSSARAGKLLVKEFETGSHASVAFLLQQTEGSEVGGSQDKKRGSTWLTTFEQICGNAAYVADTLIGLGTQVEFPGLGVTGPARSAPERREDVFLALASAEPNLRGEFAGQVRDLMPRLVPGSVVYIFIGVREDGLAEAIRQMCQNGFAVVALVYDTAAFDSTEISRSAQTPAFVDSLLDSGATVERIFKWEEVS